MVELRRTQEPYGTRIEAWIEDRSISRAVIFEKRLRIGHLSVRMAGIGGVHTRRDHRRRGYAQRVMEQVIKTAQADGYHLALLYGVPNYYDRFSFAPALYECQATVAIRDAEAVEARYMPRPMTEQDAGAIVQLYEARHAHRTASILREPATWQPFAFGKDYDDRVDADILMDGSEMVGYLAYNDSSTRCIVTEVGYQGPHVFGSLLAAAARRALAVRAERIVFCTPPDNAFVGFCQRYGCHVKTESERSAGGMARIINQPELLGTLEPLFADRLQEAGLDTTLPDLVWQTDLGTDHTRLGAGAEIRVQLPQDILVQLLLGYRSAADAFFQTEARVDPGHLPVIEALFPKGWPYIWWADRF